MVYIRGDVWAFAMLLGRSQLAAPRSSLYKSVCTVVRFLGLENRSRHRDPNFYVLKTETENRKTDISARLGSVRCGFRFPVKMCPG